MNTAGLDNTMMALADPTRRAILNRLADGEALVTELAKPFDMSLNAVSKHILIIERSVLVKRRREGREHHLSLNAEPLAQDSEWIEYYCRFWEQSFARLDDYLRELQRKEKSRRRKASNKDAPSLQHERNKHQ